MSCKVIQLPNSLSHPGPFDYEFEILESMFSMKVMLAGLGLCGSLQVLQLLPPLKLVAMI
jgi:hypothetical protein